MAISSAATAAPPVEFSEPLSIGIVGAGVMGRGIAEAAATAGLDTVLLDVDERVGSEALSEIERRLKAASLTGRMGSLRPSQVLSKIKFSTNYESVAGCTLIVENVTEDIEVKQHVYAQISSHLHEGAIVGANTSTFPIAELAAFLPDPSRLIGMHFMNPAATKTHVEVIPSRFTSSETMARAQFHLAKLGRTAIIVNDAPGFVSNRILMMVVNEAVRIVEQGIAAPARVDEIFVGCFGHAMGPLATADLIGLDTIVLSLESLKKRLDDERYDPAPLLRRLVAQNRMGRKAGGGFYDY